MADLRLLPLDEILNPAQIDQLQSALHDLGVGELPLGEEMVDLDEPFPEDDIADFLDRLDAYEMACDVYVPVEFEGRIDVGGETVGSTQALLEALEELREELDIDAEASPPEEGELDLELVESQLIQAWHGFMAAAQLSIEHEVPLQVVP